MEPLIYFSYGMTKSGSTLAFEYAKALLEHQGCTQTRLSDGALGNAKRINYVDDVTQDMAFEIWAEVAQIGHPIVIKTHAKPSPAVRNLITSGQARAHACLRDPRDMALSMMDHGRRARETGEAAFAEIETLTDAIRAIQNQTQSLKAWLSLPGVPALDYHAIAFAPETVLPQMADQLGLPQNWPAHLPRTVASSRFTQLNRGVPHRHTQELSLPHATHIIQDCAELMALLPRPTPASQRPMALWSRLWNACFPSRTASE